MTQWKRFRLPMQETRVPSLGQEDPLKREWQPAPVFLPGKSHGQRSLAGYSPRGHIESDSTEHKHTHTGGMRLRPDDFLKSSPGVCLLFVF